MSERELARARILSASYTDLLCDLFFFFNDTATTEIYTLSLHDALPIYGGWVVGAAPLCIEEAIELADGREPPGHRRGREATLAERSEITAQVLGRGTSDAASDFAELCGEVGEVTGIGGERVLRSPALGRDHIEEQLDQGLVGSCGLQSHSAMTRSGLLGEPVRRNRNRNLARLRIDPGCEYEHGAIGQAAQNTDQSEESEQTRHDEPSSANFA